MGQFAARFRNDHPVYRLEAGDSGLLLIRRTGQDKPFDELTRSLINDAGADFAVFPTTEGSGYERVFVVPI